MGTLTISSGVYVNGALSTTSRFTTLTLTNVESNLKDKQYAQRLTGHEDAAEPITFDWTGGRAIYQKLPDLYAISPRRVARGPRVTLSGTIIDAVVDSRGELCKFTYTVRNRQADTTSSHSAWGYFRILNPTITGITETITLALYPITRLRHTNTTDYFDKGA